MPTESLPRRFSVQASIVVLATRPIAALGSPVQGLSLHLATRSTSLAIMPDVAPDGNQSYYIIGRCRGRLEPNSRRRLPQEHGLTGAVSQIPWGVSGDDPRYGHGLMAMCTLLSPDCFPLRADPASIFSQV